VLTISGVLDAHRQIAFHTLQELLAFQSGFESHLIATGWSLVAFSPDRRAPREANTASERPKRWFSRLLTRTSHTAERGADVTGSITGGLGDHSPRSGRNAASSPISGRNAHKP
jgi:hypothetical protein